MTRKIRAEMVACELCGSTRSAAIAVGNDYEYLTSDDSWVYHRCEACQHLFLRERPISDDVGRIYPPSYYSLTPDSAQYSSLIQRLRRNVEIGRYRRLARFLPAESAILDVGVGDGHVLRYLRGLLGGRGRYVGLDLNLSSQTQLVLRRHGIEYIDGVFEAHPFEPETRFDLVIMTQVIEHLWHPKEAVQQVVRLLRPGGILFIETPNPACLGRMIQRFYWGGYHYPRHLNIFSASGMRTLLGADFEVLVYKQYANPAFWIMGSRNRKGLNSVHTSASSWEFVNAKSIPLLCYFMGVEVIASVFGFAANHRFVARRT